MAAAPTAVQQQQAGGMGAGLGNRRHGCRRPGCSTGVPPLPGCCRRSTWWGGARGQLRSGCWGWSCNMPGGWEGLGCLLFQTTGEKGAHQWQLLLDLVMHRLKHDEDRSLTLWLHQPKATHPSRHAKGWPIHG
jgi:hypothetical protein